MTDSGRVDRQQHDYDALLVVSFGGPEGPADVVPFLDNVFRGLAVSEETKTHVAARYERFGGVSPINDQTRALIDALQRKLDAHGPALPIYWGNRNWHPFLADTLAQMASAGVERALAFVTSTFSSYSGCRKYREDLYDAVLGLTHAPVIDKLRMPFNHPLFVEAVAARAADALAALPPGVRERATILFTAHSLPEAMARQSRYEVQLGSACELVAGVLEHSRWQLVYQSNNASYGRGAWLGPDIGDALRACAAAGATEVVVMPIGFVCDHLEVVLDLDVDAAAVARELGITMVRAATVGTHPAYIEMIRELVLERMTPGVPRRAAGALGASVDICGAACCLSGRPGPAKPSLCGVDDPRYRLGSVQ